MGYASPFIRVYANETRGATGRAKTHCKFCGEPVTWFTTQANERPMLVDGHDPVPHRTEKTDDGRTIEVHHRDTLHLNTCDKRERPEPSLPSDRARENDRHCWRHES